MGNTNTKEECVQKARGEYPDATGVSWTDYEGKCFADFGNKLIPYPSDIWIWYGCMFHGISYCIDLYILQFYDFEIMIITYNISQ